MMHASGCALGDDPLMRFGGLGLEGVGDRLRNRLRRMDFIEHVAIAFEQPKGLAGERKHLVAVGGLHYPYQRLGMKGIGDDR